MLKKNNLELGICNAKKRRNLVTFDWRVSKDVRLKNFMWAVSRQVLWGATAKTAYHRRKRYTLYEISEYLHGKIAELCAARWPQEQPDVLPPHAANHALAHADGRQVVPARALPLEPSREPNEAPLQGLPLEENFSEY
jgi:hypothetical protein